MHKSSVYLPDELKGALAEVAGRSGHSEADLIRKAIERLLSSAGNADDRVAPSPAAPVFARPALLGVGVGPGDPGLITEKAKAALIDADRIIVLSTDPRSIGRAEMVVSSVAPTSTIVRVSFVIAPDPAGRRASLRTVADEVLAAVDAGELAVLALLGDPSQWTIFPELAALVAAERPGLAVSAVPGITSYQAIAASTSMALGRPGAPLVVTDEGSTLDARLAEGHGCVVLYKASIDAHDLKAAAERHHRDHAVVGELLGLPGERLRPLADTPDGPLSYLSTVVVPASAPASVARPK